MKMLFYVLIVVVAICLINFWYQIYILGQYYKSAGLFFTVIAALIPIVVVIISYKLINYIKNNKR